MAKPATKALAVCLMTCMPLAAAAQSWLKKASQAVFTLKTFTADGTLLGSSNGFFISDNGDAVSSFTPFRGAHRAVIVDAQAKEWPVEYLAGANDMFDVARFKVAAKKTTPLPMAQAATAGSTAWMLPYSAKKAPVARHGTVSNTELFQETYTYYTLAIPADEEQAGCPVLNDGGEVIGLLQPSHDSNTGQSYAVSATFASQLRLNGLSLNEPAMRATAMPKAIPDQLNDALLALYVANASMDAAQYAEYIERFIRQYPGNAEGYIYRARLNAGNGQYASADRDMQQALKVADKKDDAHYQYAQLIYHQQLAAQEQHYEPWTLDRAMAESEQAYNANPQPLYRRQQAQILYAQQKYDEAYERYMELSHTDLRSADDFYAAAQCKLQKGEKEAFLQLLDSAVNIFTKPYVKTAAPYLLARAQARYDAGKFRAAVADYNDYEAVMPTQTGAVFYYLREQAEFAGHLYQQAIDDIKRAIGMAPDEPVYYAEKANVELHVGLTDDALQTAADCIRVAPDMSDGYLFLGLAQCLKGMKSEGVQNLTKAKELGNSQAQGLIDKYSR